MSRATVNEYPAIFLSQRAILLPSSFANSDATNLVIVLAMDVYGQPGNPGEAFLVRSLSSTAVVFSGHLNGVLDEQFTWRGYLPFIDGDGLEVTVSAGGVFDVTISGRLETRIQT